MAGIFISGLSGPLLYLVTESRWEEWGLKYGMFTFIYRVKALYKSHDRVTEVLTLPRLPDLTLFGIVSVKEQRALIR